MFFSKLFATYRTRAVVITDKRVRIVDCTTPVK